MSSPAPALDINIYDEEALLDPFENYRAIRDAGPVVRLSSYGEVYALARYANVRAALADPARFSSARGTALNEATNERLANTVLGSDDPIHARMRAVLTRPLAPDHLEKLRGMMSAEADGLVGRLFERGDFDAVSDLATHLPVTIVAELVGLPAEGRERMLEWAAAAFNAMGPSGSRLTTEAIPIAGEMAHYAFDPALADKVRPGSWAAQLFEAEAKGEISRLECGKLITDYLAPALDTTIFAIANAVWLFAEHPEQWTWLRENPDKLPPAINEILRIESPIQAFSRFVPQAVEIEGVSIPEGARALMLYGSANRDERKWGDPETFNVQRRSADHLAFGHSIHVCAGMNLAKLETLAILRALLARVSGFSLVTRPMRVCNNSLRGFKSLPVRVH